jgi:hypothetical protein
MIAAVALTILLVGQAAAEREQRLQGAFDSVIQSVASGWSLFGAQVRETDSIYKWRTNPDDKDVVVLIVRRFVNHLEAAAELQGTAKLLSVGPIRVDGLGDGAFVGSVPGGPQNYYIRVENILVQLHVPRSIKEHRRIAERMVQVLRDTP